jgi:hypothetical protein
MQHFPLVAYDSSEALYQVLGLFRTPRYVFAPVHTFPNATHQKRPFNSEMRFSPRGVVEDVSFPNTRSTLL